MANTTGQKFGGRKKGVSNKITQKIRKSFSDLLENNIGQIQDDLNNLEPKDRVKLILDLAGFVIPRMKSIDIPNLNLNNPTIKITYGGDSDDNNDSWKENLKA